MRILAGVFLAASLSCGWIAWLSFRDQRIELVPVSKLRIDYGLVDRGEERKFEFRCRNAGTTAITLLDVWSTCGCVIVQRPDVVVKPGEEVVVEGQIDASVSGSRESRLYVTFREDGTSREIGRVRFAVRSGWQTRNRNVRYELSMDSISDYTPTLPLVLKTDEAKLPTVTKVWTTCPGIRFSRIETSHDAVRIWPEFLRELPLGEYPVNVIVESTSKNAPRYEIELEIANCATKYQTTPVTLTTGFSEPGQARKIRFVLTRGDDAVEVTGVSSWDEHVAVASWETDEIGRTTVRLLPDETVTQSRECLICISFGTHRYLTQVLMGIRSNRGA